MLAERYGVEIERRARIRAPRRRRRRKARLWELLERTAKYYERYLWEAPKAEKARAYLLGRAWERRCCAASGSGWPRAPGTRC